MQEDLLHYLWEIRIAGTRKLQTTCGQSLEIVHPGTRNANQGPDFLFSRLLIGGLSWAGHVELHVNASDWAAHGHGADPHYKNVILHVVWNADAEVYCEGTLLPCLELGPVVPEALMKRYEGLMHAANRLPCHALVAGVPGERKAIWFERLMVERFQQKCEEVREEWISCDSDWEAMFFRRVARYLVAPVNGEAMTMLCARLPLQALRKLRHDPLALEAALLGTAGMLGNAAADPYVKDLQREYDFLQRKLGFEALGPAQWKFLRMRPAQFPDLRLAQLAALLFQRHNWLGDILELTKPRESHAFFDVTPSEYWATHSHLGAPASRYRRKAIGKAAADVLLINAICPVMFAYGSMQSLNIYCERARELLQSVPPEYNTCSRLWKSHNFVLENAGHSQAGLQLYRKYCVDKKCTRCMIGDFLLKKTIGTFQNQAFVNPK
ncbi:MAG: DUF2851 family protein [Saprospiraceae bacterium]|nr:DUF2851 family protein [Saprospiraceae bacterium]